MKFDEYQQRLNQLQSLVLYSNTGSPKDLAKKFKISERTVRRMVDQLKNKNNPIEFCRKSNSYVLKKQK
jgi:transcriptional antiterminator